MELVLFALAVTILPTTLLFAPQKALTVVAWTAGLLALIVIVWAWRLSATCAGFGCIDAGIAQVTAMIFVGLIVVAGGIRWAIIRFRDSGAKQ